MSTEGQAARGLPGLLTAATRILFFTGKGGVGKTTMSCATAVSLAREDAPVLLVSTDPASNLDEVLQTRLGPQPRRVPGAPGLHALNVDPHAAAGAYREAVVGPYRGVLPDDVVASIEEQLSGACTVEIAAFGEFARLLGDPALTREYRHIVFDTAPTGHTLRLLALPAAWSGFIQSSQAGTSCIGPLQGMGAQREVYAAAVTALGDTSTTAMVLVSRPDAGALREAERTRAELAALGIRHQRLVVNGMFRAWDHADTLAQAIQGLGERALSGMAPGLAALPRDAIALRSRQVLGVAALRGLLDPAARGDGVAPAMSAEERLPEGLLPWTDLIEGLLADGHGLVMTMGKGGVGKTTVAARIALALAQRGAQVHLTTTDPAAHAAGALDERPPGLTVGAIDPGAEVAAYRTEVLATTGAQLDAHGLALLNEDLSSPCTEEIAVFQAFAREVERARGRIVVMDTAPTGHTVLLLDAAQSYHREVQRQAKEVSNAVRGLLPRLRDPCFTRMLLCTLAEATPVHEAAALQAELRRAGMEPYAWVVNQSLLPLNTSDALLQGRRAQEQRYVQEVLRDHAARCCLLPWQAELAAGRVAQAQFQAS